MSASDLFEDLKSLSTKVVKEKYAEVVEEIETLDAQRKDIYLQKKLHSEVIQFAVNKLAEAPPHANLEPNDLLLVIIEQKSEFDQRLNQRDELMAPLAVPRPRLQYLLNEFYQRLTQQTHHTEAPSLASEMEMFSRFFEIQAMLEIYNTQIRDILSEIHALRRALLENVKSINIEDRKLAQELNRISERAKSTRREAGRLRAYLQSVEGKSPAPLPEPSEELTQRLASGGALSMEEFTAMLEHGGLTELELDPAIQSGKKTRQGNKQRRAKPLRRDAGKPRNRRT